MKFVVDLRKSTYERIASLVEKHRLDGISQFLQIAIENQLALEDLEEGPFVVPTETGAVSQPLSNIVEEPAIEVWRGLHATDVSWDEIEIADPSHVESAPIWGQYNRLLPVKVAVRVLARELVSHGKSVPLTDFHAATSKIAVRVRRFLETVDNHNETPRGERLSTGFPEGREKSVQRFQAHFLGYLQGDGTAVGALPQLGFVSISPEPGNSVFLTKPGLELARLSNPLIDGESPYSRSLSPKEVDFLLSHIKRSLPIEFEFITTLLQWISQGTRTPEELTKRIQRAYPEWSRKVANSMRTGALGRMHDLGLIIRERDGRHVTYELQPGGDRLVSKKRK